MLNHTKKIRIEKIVANKRLTKTDIVIEEFPFTIKVNGEAIVTLLCVPLNLDYLALGFLESEGIIKGKTSIKKLEFDQENGSIDVKVISEENIVVPKTKQAPTLTTGCGKGTTFYNNFEMLQLNPVNSQIYISAKKIFEFIHELQMRSELYKLSKAVHISTLASTSEILYAHEDIGRHNALDKLFGECMTKEISYDDKIIVTSGRISSEMIIKCAKRKIPILISPSVATGLAIEIAQKTGVTLIGYVRGNRMKIYSNPLRVTV